MQCSPEIGVLVSLRMYVNYLASAEYLCQHNFNHTFVLFQLFCNICTPCHFNLIEKISFCVPVAFHFAFYWRTLLGYFLSGTVALMNV